MLARWPTLDGPLSEPSVGYFVCFLVSLHRKLALLLPLVVFVLALDDIGDRVNLILQGFVLRFEFVDAPPILRVSSALA